MSNLAFYAADTLGATLYQIEGKLVATEIRKLFLGPWQIDMPVQVVSDLITPKEIGFWVTLGAKLPCYLIVREKECWFIVLDPAKLKECGKKSGFVGETAHARMKEVQSAIQAMFVWEHATQSWGRLKLEEQKRWD